MEFKNYTATKNKEGNIYLENNNLAGIHTGNKAVLLPEIVSTPLKSVLNIIKDMRDNNKFNNPYATDKPLSGADPIGLFIVEGAALNPVFKLAGKAALYGAGRLGSNYARAKLLSGAMQEVGTLENKIPLNVGWGPKLNLNVYHASDSPIDKFKFPNKDNWAVKTNNHPSDIIYFSEGNSPASGFLSKRQYVLNYNIKLNKPMVQVGEALNIPTKNIERNKLLRFALSNNADAYIMLDIADNLMKHQNIISNFSDKNINKVFKSEIDWNKWNKEIPLNKPLLNEYHNIEQASKASGNWMKNSDGSVFKGTPELFIQLRSLNFKKWFGDWLNNTGDVSKVINENKQPLVVYHGSENKFNNFSIDKFSSTGHSEGVYGKGHYFTSNKNTANNYGNNNELYSVYLNIKNPLSCDLDETAGNFGYFKSLKDLKNHFKDVIEENKISDKELNNLYGNFDSADGVVIDDINGEKYSEVVAPNSNQIKSATGNNGMFDITNPNIYKTVAAGLSLQGLNKLNK